MNIYDELKKEIKNYLLLVTNCVQTDNYKISFDYLNMLPSSITKIQNLCKYFEHTQYQLEAVNFLKIVSMIGEDLLNYCKYDTLDEMEYALALYPKISSLVYIFAYLEELKNNANNLKFIVINHKSCLGVTLIISYPDFQNDFEERLAVIRPGTNGFFLTATPNSSMTIRFAYQEPNKEKISEYKELKLTSLSPGFNVFSFGDNPMENDFEYKITSNKDNKFMKLMGIDPNLL